MDLMNLIIVKSVRAVRNQLIIDFDCKGQIRKFFKGTRFFVEYSSPIEDAPESILVIPFLSTICPIAWVNQAEIRVETVDKKFLQSLEKVRLALKKFYPEINFNGTISVNKIVTSPTTCSKKAMMLFGGGVDSLTTFVRHRTEKPILVDIHSEGVYANSYKQRTLAGYLKEFSYAHGVKTSTIYSNFDFLKDDLMLLVFYEKLGGLWWLRVMHGLAYLGLCAPVAYMYGVEKLYIASSFSESFRIPWGSAPEIDNNVAWTGTQCIHDCFELSRQEKIQFLAEYINRERDMLHVFCCNRSEKMANCCKCEKCSRTITGLTFAGLDPNNHGFNINRYTFLKIKKNLENGAWVFGDDEKYMWTDLQKHAHDNRLLLYPEAEALADWLAKVDIKTIGAKTTTRKALLRFVLPSFKFIPCPLWIANQKFLKALELIFPNLLFQ